MPLVTRNHPKLTLEGARAVLAAAQRRASEIHCPMDIAIVDDGAHLLVFERMDGAKPSSIAIALVKANQVADAFEPLAEVVNDLAARGARAVVLGCTEIPLGIQAGPASRLNVPVIDTIDALARAAIAWARD